MEDALKLIIAKSPQAASQAMKTIQAVHAKSPMLQHRYNAAVDAALNDSQAEFTPDERQLLARFVAAGERIRETRLQVRVTITEKLYLRQMASEQNLTLSDFIRQKVGLEPSA
jgi:hypothetical protein